MRYAILLLLTLFAMPAQAAETITDAARAGDIPAIEAALRAGERVDSRTAEGYTPFILAAYHAHNGALEVLKAAGANPCAIDERGNNAFMGVAFRGHTETAKWLLEHTGCDVNARNHMGQTGLMMAALFAREDIITLLLEKGADPALTDKAGNTAAALAKMQGAEHISTLLE